MKHVKNTLFFVLGLLVTAGLGAAWLEPAGAAPLNLSDAIRGPLVPIKVDPGIFIPLPMPTPPATPEASPSGDDGDLTPVGYNFDGNDYLFFFYDEKYTLTIDGGTPVDYTEAQNLRFTLTPEGDNPAIDLVVGIQLLEPGKFKLQVGDFDATKYKVNLEILKDSTATSPATTLNSGSIIELVAHNMNALMYEGENVPETGAKAQEQVVLGNRKTVYLFSQKSGTLLIKSRDILDPDEINTNPNPIPNPNPPKDPAPPIDVPKDPSNNPGPVGQPPLPAAAGDLGGGHGGLKCSLGGVGPWDLGGILFWVGAFLPLGWLGRRIRKSK